MSSILIERGPVATFSIGKFSNVMPHTILLKMYSITYIVSSILGIISNTNWRLTLIRSSRPEVFCERGVLENFTKFTGKHLCQSNFVKFLRTPLFIEHLLAAASNWYKKTDQIRTSNIRKINSKFTVIQYSYVVVQNLVVLKSIILISSAHFFFYLGFLLRTFTNHRIAEEGEGISLTPRYHFQPLHRHLDIYRAITAESSSLHIATSTAHQNASVTRVSPCH